jgi:hypothetical protein
VKGGREGRDVDALQLAQVCEKLDAAEILLNCIDKDGTKRGFDIELISHIRDNVTIPVTASCGAGIVEHFSEVFKKLGRSRFGRGIYHREEVPIEGLRGICVREVWKRDNSDNFTVSKERPFPITWKGPFLFVINKVYYFNFCVISAITVSIARTISSHFCGLSASEWGRENCPESLSKILATHILNP